MSMSPLTMVTFRIQLTYCFCVTWFGACKLDAVRKKKLMSYWQKDNCPHSPVTLGWHWSTSSFTLVKNGVKCQTKRIIMVRVFSLYRASVSKQRIYRNGTHAQHGQVRRWLDGIQRHVRLVDGFDYFNFDLCLCLAPEGGYKCGFQYS